MENSRVATVVNTTVVVEANDSESLVFLKWLLPVIGCFVLFAIVIFAVKLWIRSKGYQRRLSARTRHRHDCPVRSNPEGHPTSRDSMLGSSSATQRVPIPVPSIRIPSQPVCIPTVGSLGTGSIPASSIGGARNSILGPTRSLAASVRNGPTDAAPMRTAPISIPAHSQVGGGGAAPIVIRPVIHHEATVVPPSYEEATAEHSTGGSTDSLDEEPDIMTEYHPPSYEDASQGKTDLVSSWVSTSRQRPT